MVISVPLLARAQRDQEHIRVRELSQNGCRVLATEDRVAQLGCEASQHRGAHQEIPSLGRERRQNLICQVVPKVASAAGEGPHPLIGVVEVAKPQRRQVQPCRPSLRVLGEQLHAFAGQLDPLTHHQLTRLVEREGQLARADLRERPARPQAREADRRVRARRYEQTHARRQALDRVADRSKRRLAPDGVEIVENDRCRLAVGDQGVHQLVDRCIDRRAADTEAHQRSPSEALTEALDGRCQMGPQPCRVVVRRVERHPNDGLMALDAPRPQKRGLAVADRGVDQREGSPPSPSSICTRRALRSIPG